MSDCDIFIDEYFPYNELPSDEECFYKAACIPAHEDMYDQQTYIED